MRALCLSGPRHGYYEDVETAEAMGYVEQEWAPGHSERVLLHSATAADAFTTDGVPVEFDEDEYR